MGEQSKWLRAWEPDSATPLPETFSNTAFPITQSATDKKVTGVSLSDAALKLLRGLIASDRYFVRRFVPGDFEGGFPAALEELIIAGIATSRGPYENLGGCYQAVLVKLDRRPFPYLANVIAVLGEPIEQPNPHFKTEG